MNIGTDTTDGADMVDIHMVDMEADGVVTTKDTTVDTIHSTEDGVSFIFFSQLDLSQLCRT